MKVIVAGSRTIPIQITRDILESHEWLPEITELVCGCARGVDWDAKTVLHNGLGIPCKDMPADWDGLGKSAGYVRNNETAEYADALIAIWDKKSKGTKHMIDLARRRNLKVSDQNEDVTMQQPIYMYRTQDGKSIINFELVDGKIAMTYKNIAKLFGKDEYTINAHVKNILAEGELLEEAVTSEIKVTASDGKSYLTKHFDLKVILAVGMRVSSQEGTLFRQWAIEHLHGLAVDGYSIDHHAIQNDPIKFNSLHTAVKKIRAEENLSWVSLLKEYKNSIDFNSDLDTRLFVAAVQNKLHYATHGHTASELIYTRADHTQPAMGLLSCSGDSLVKRDIYVAKNYMTENELERLDKLVRRILDFASDMSHNCKGIKLDDWMVKLNGILELSDRPVLMEFSKIKRKEAINKANLEFYKYVHEMQSKPNCPYPPNGQVFISDA